MRREQLALGLLWRDVAGRSLNALFARIDFDRLTEVNDLGAAIIGVQNIERLHVRVDESAFMHVHERRRNIVENREALGDRRALQICERLRVDELHDESDITRLLEEPALEATIDELANGRMIELATDLPLRADLIDPAIFLVVLGDDVLECVCRVGVRIFDQIDAAERTIAQRLSHAIAVQHFTWVHPPSLSWCFVHEATLRIDAGVRDCGTRSNRWRYARTKGLPASMRITPS